jgi:hypothetical protein
MIIGSEDVADPHMSSGRHTFIAARVWDELDKKSKEGWHAQTRRWHYL